MEGMAGIGRLGFVSFAAATIAIAVAISLSLPFVGLQRSTSWYDDMTYTWHNNTITSRFYLDHIDSYQVGWAPYEKNTPISNMMWLETVLLYCWILAGWLLAALSLARDRLLTISISWAAAVIGMASVVNIFANSSPALGDYGDTITWGNTVGFHLVIVSFAAQITLAVVLTWNLLIPHAKSSQPAEPPSEG